MYTFQNTMLYIFCPYFPKHKTVRGKTARMLDVCIAGLKSIKWTQVCITQENCFSQ